MRNFIKYTQLILNIVVILIVFCGCNYFKISKNNSSTNVNYTKISEESETTNSITKKTIFKGEISNYKIEDLRLVDVKRNNDIWIINGKNYNQQKDEYQLIAMRSHWEINLNEFTPTGISKDSTVVFTPKYISDPSVLVAKKSDKYFFLVASNHDVLNPQNYSFDDFNYKSSQLNMEIQQIASLWETHINTNIYNFLEFSDGIPSTITLTLKKVPGLVYKFDYIKYGDEYHTSIPWGTESQKTGDG